MVNIDSAITQSSQQQKENFTLWFSEFRTVSLVDFDVIHLIVVLFFLLFVWVLSHPFFSFPPY